MTPATGTLSVNRTGLAEWAYTGHVVIAVSDATAPVSLRPTRTIAPALVSCNGQLIARSSDTLTPQAARWLPM